MEMALYSHRKQGESVRGEKREEMRNLGLEDSRQWEAAANISWRMDNNSTERIDTPSDATERS